MYQINEENLKYAYGKFKKYIYYFNSSNYLKDKIIYLEEIIKINPNIFKEYADTLNSLSLINYNMLNGYSIDYMVFPKKDTIELDDLEKISIKNINLFIDMDIMFYLNDVLFCFELFELYKNKNNHLFFGNKMDKKLDRIENPLENNLLFDTYWPNYKAWKNEMSRGLTAKEIKNSTLVKIDFQRCFYQTRFKLKKFLLKNNIDINNPIVKIAINIYRLYSSKIFSLRNEEKDNEIVQLPIGLPSSMIIQNILFSSFDNNINSNPKVLRYSRYVDDVLILINDSISSKNEFAKLFSDLISLDSDKQLLFVDVNSDFLESLKLNNKKIELKNALSVLTLKNEVERIMLPSMMDFLEEDSSENDENFEFEFGDSLSQSYMKKQINYYFENKEKTDVLIEYLKERKDNELLNLLPSWNKIINLLNDTDYYNIFLARIKNAIKHIDVVEDDYFINSNFVSKIKQRFNIELDTSIKLLNKLYYLFDIDQEQIFDYLDKILKGATVFFPLKIKLEYIQLYHCYINGFREDNLQKSIELFENVNNYKLHSMHPINEIRCSSLVDSDLSVVNEKYVIAKKYSKVIKFNYLSNDEHEKQIKVAISSIKMPYDSVCESDETGHFAKDSYNLKDIKKIIKTAKDNNAEYLLLPEFCVPFWEIKNILDYCVKSKISLITGLTHLNFKDLAVNMVLIYDYRMKLVLMKEKNYYPYKENMLLAGRGLKSLDVEPYYFIIDNGFIKYSTMTCFEATNIRDRAFLNGKIEVLFIPVYNEDTTYFSNIISSLSRDISGFIIQANNSEYGDSRITGPMNTYSKEVVQLKGGENHYVVVGTLDFEAMHKKHSEMNDVEIMISDAISKSPSDRDDEIKKIKEKISLLKKNPFKPLSAGSLYEDRKKEGLEE